MIRMMAMECPSSHIILGLAYQEGEYRREIIERRLVTAIAGAIHAGLLNPWCGICRASLVSWTWKDKPTEYTTMGEAQREIEKLNEVELQRMAREERGH